MSMGPKSGVRPRSIRKKGFWRAYRRKELWAIVSYDMEKCMDQLKSHFARVLFESMIGPNTLYMTYSLDLEEEKK